MENIIERPDWWYIKIFGNCENMRISEKNWKNMKIWSFREEKNKGVWDEEALYESSVRKLGWRFTARLPYRTEMNWRQTGPAKIYEVGRRFYVFNDLLYYGYWFCYIQMKYIILKFNSLWILASVVDQTLINNHGVCFPKSWKNTEIFEFWWKLSKKYSGARN